MAITVISTTGSEAGSGGTSIVINNPSGLSVGDLLIAQIGVYDSESITYNTPSGWTLIQSGGVATSSPAMVTYYRVVNGSEGASTSFTTNQSTGGFVGKITHITGADATSPISVSSEQYNNTASTTGTGSTITPTTSNSMILFLITTNGTTTPASYALATSSPSFTEAYETSAENITVALAYGIRPEVTATGNATCTWTGNQRSAVHIVAINPTILLTTNLVSYYKLDESSGNAADSVGSNTLTNTDVTYSSGKINNGAVFDSTTDRLSTSADTDFNFTGASGFTLSAWTNQTTLVNDSHLITHIKSTANFEGYNLQVDAAGKVLFYIGQNNAGSDLIYVTTAAGTITTGVWYHILVTYDGTKTVAGTKIYVNGVSQSLTTVFNNFTGSASWNGDFQIGNREGQNVNYAGTIDEVGIWSRALSANEVSQLYNSKRALAYPLTAPTLYGGVAYYKLDESSGNASDSIGSNTLTNNNTVTYSAGKINNASAFVRASSQYLSASNDLGITGGAISISCWLKPASLPSSDSPNTGQGNANVYSVVTTGDAGTQVKYSITLARVGGVQKIGLARLRENVSYDVVDYTTTLSTSTWYHLVLTYNTTNVVAYLNGSAIGSPVASSGNGSGGTADYIYIGAGQNNGPSVLSNLDGSVDEACIFNRALTSTEVTELYNSGTGLQYPWASSPALSTGNFFAIL